jgi:hypothetical protein
LIRPDGYSYGECNDTVKIVAKKEWQKILSRPRSTFQPRTQHAHNDNAPNRIAFADRLRTPRSVPRSNKWVIWSDIIISEKIETTDLGEKKDKIKYSEVCQKELPDHGKM